MAEFVEILSPKAKADLEQANAELVKMLSNMKAVNSATIGAKTPSGSDSALKSLTAEYDKQQKIIISLQKELQKLAEIKQKNNVKTSEEIVNQRTLAQNADRQTRATSQLVGAYANLNAKHQQVAKSLQDLIVRGRQAGQSTSQYNKELRQAQKEFNTLNQRIISADRAVGRFNRNVGNYPTSAIRGIRDLIGAFGIVGGVSLFAMMARDIFNTAKELQGLNNALKLVTETQGNFSEQQQFLQRISEAYGLELKGLTKQFTQFYVSAKDKLSGQEIQQIFESISKAGGAMGLSVQQQDRAFLALNQMMSKGSIQAEELRGQLGEALPGAFGIMAKAMGVNEKELGNMMKAGDLLAKDALPRFAKQLEKTYGIENLKRIDTITTAVNRLSNEWTNSIASITSGGGFNSFLINSINQLTNYLAKIRVLFSEMGTQFELIKTYLKDIFPESLVNGFSNLISGFTSVANSVTVFKAALEVLSYLFYVTLPQSVNVSLGALRKIGKVMAEISTLGSAKTTSFADIDKATNATNEAIKELYLTRRRKIQQDAENQKSEQLNVDLQGEATKAEGKATDKKREKIDVLKLEAKESESITQWLKKQIALNEELKESTNGREVRAGIQKNIDFLKMALANLEGEVDPLQDNAKKALDEFGEYAKTLGVTVEEVVTDWKGIFDDWSGVAMQSLDLVSQAQDNEFVKRMNQLEKERDLAIQFAGDSAEEKEEIDRQYEQKRLALEKKRFEQEKRLNIIRAVIDTAGAVIGALPNIPLAIAVGALGAIQLGIIASQQYPEFYKGTDDAPEGWAWTQERGREIITDRNGKIKSTGVDGGAKMTYLKKGDKVIPNEQTEAILFNNELNSMLMGSGINPSITLNNDELKTEIRELGKIIKNKSSITVIEDKRGKRIFEKSQSSRKELVNNRIKIKGSDV